MTTTNLRLAPLLCTIAIGFGSAGCVGDEEVPGSEHVAPGEILVRAECRVLRDGYELLTVYPPDDSAVSHTFERQIVGGGTRVSITSVEALRGYLRPIESEADALACSELLRELQLPDSEVPGVLLSFDPVVSGEGFYSEQDAVRWGVEHGPRVRAKAGRILVERLVVTLNGTSIGLSSDEAVLVLLESFALDGAYAWEVQEVLEENLPASDFYPAPG